MNARFIHTTMATCSLFLCLSLGTAFAEPLNAEGQRHFEAGVAYVDDPSGSKWEDALKEFRAAHAASPNWKLMNNIGLCALNLERDGEAIDAFRDYLSHGGESDFSVKQKKQMEKDIKMLTASLVRVSIEIEPASAMLLDERRNAKGEVLLNQYPLKDGKASLGIHPGLHKFTLQAPGYVSAEWSFNADPSSTHQHTFKLEPEKKPEVAPPKPTTTNTEKTVVTTTEPPKPAVRKTPTSVYIGLAATGVFAVAGTVTGVLAMKKDKDFDNATTQDDRDSAKKTGQTYAWIADIGFGAAAISAGVTAYLYFTAPKAAPEAPRSARIQLSPTVSPSAAGLTLSGKF